MVPADGYTCSLCYSRPVFHGVLKTSGSASRCEHSGVAARVFDLPSASELCRPRLPADRMYNHKSHRLELCFVQITGDELTDVPLQELTLFALVVMARRRALKISTYNLLKPYTSDLWWAGKPREESKDVRLIRRIVASSAVDRADKSRRR